MRVLVTGATGFLGRHLVARLRQDGHEVHGTSSSVAVDSASHTVCDILDSEALAALVARVKARRIFHLAGFASVRRAMEQPALCWDLNVRSTVHLLEAARLHSPEATIVLIGSAMQYGVTGDAGGLIRESDPQRPREPYGASKAAAELAGAQWASFYGLEVVLLRVFNVIGPGQSTDFASADFACQVARIERGLQKPVISTGNLGIARDLLDARDAAAAFALAADGCRPAQPYNVCTGQAVSIRGVLDILRSLSRVPFEIEVSDDRVRAVDIPVLRGDPTAFRQATGWQPAIPLRQTLSDVLEAWRGAAGGRVVAR